MALPPASAAAAGAMPPDPDADASAAPDDGSGSGQVVVTICKMSDGSYMVYGGDEPDSDASDMSADDADAMGAAGGAPAAGSGGMGGGMAGGMGGGMMGGGGAGQPADSIGSALKIAMDLMQADKSSEGMTGNSDDQLSAGYGADKNPTPATGMKAKA